MRRVLPRLLLIVLILAPSSFAAAQATVPAATPATAALTLATKQIEITLRGSRLQVVAGSGFGIWADIKNISNGPVFMNPKFFTMTPPSEVSRADGPQDWASVMSGSFLLWDYHDPYNKVMRLEAQSTTTAFWPGPGYSPRDVSWHKSLWESGKNWLGLVNFVPGEYTFKVVGAYWSEVEPAAQVFRRVAAASAELVEKDARARGADAPTMEKAETAARAARDASAKEEAATVAATGHRSEIAEIKIAVTAPQSIVLVGAGIGGLIAYFLLPNVRLRPHRFAWMDLAAAALLSTIVTILVSRISEAQFPVKISVNDFWGAITMGFIAGASGTAILKKYTGGAAAHGDGAPKDPKPDAPPPPAPAPAPSFGLRRLLRRSERFRGTRETKERPEG